MNPVSKHSQPATAPLAISDRAFADFYALHFSQVKAFLARIGCESHSLDDLAQETFLRAWFARRRFSGTVRFRTWLFAIARNTARESWRKEASVRSLNHEPANAPCSQSADAPDTADAVRAAVDRLPPKQRTAITLVYLDGIAQKDAADRANCAHDAFRRRLANGRMRLRTFLQPDQLDR